MYKYEGMRGEGVFLGQFNILQKKVFLYKFFVKCNILLQYILLNIN